MKNIITIALTVVGELDWKVDLAAKRSVVSARDALKEKNLIPQDAEETLEVSDGSTEGVEMTVYKSTFITETDKRADFSELDKDTVRKIVVESLAYIRPVPENFEDFTFDSSFISTKDARLNIISEEIES